MREADLVGAAAVRDGVGVVVAGLVGVVVAGPLEEVPVGAEACTEGSDEERAGVPEPTWGADESWHPANSRIPPTAAITDEPLRPGIAHPLFAS